MSYITVLGQSTRSEKQTKVRRHAAPRRWQFGYVTLMIVTVLFNSILGLVYFLQVQRMTFAGYEISEMEVQVREYEELNLKLEYDLSQQKSLSIIERQAVDQLQMVPTTQVRYWWGENEEFAARQ